MNFFPPLLYLVSILVFLLLILIFIIRQIFSLQILKNDLSKIQSKINLKQGSQDIYLNLGQIYLKKQLYLDALEIFRKCLIKWDKQDKIGVAYLYTFISLSYLKLNFLDISQFYLEQAIDNIPNFTIALNNLMYIFQQQQLMKKYIELLNYKKYLETK